MPVDTKKFRAELAVAEAKLYADDLVKFHKKIHFEVLNRIVLRTPVDQGRARANWQSSVNEIPSDQVLGLDVAGTATVVAGLQAISALPPFAVTYIMNNVPYIIPLEEGHSPQSPPGNMIAGSVAEVEVLLP